MYSDDSLFYILYLYATYVAQRIQYSSMLEKVNLNGTELFIIEMGQVNAYNEPKIRKVLRCNIIKYFSFQPNGHSWSKLAYMSIDQMVH